MNDKPKGKPLPVQQNEHRTGRLGEDDRGNVTWTWANEPELRRTTTSATSGTAARPGVLVHPAQRVAVVAEDHGRILMRIGQ